ncbi:MAG: TolC family protein, partial [Calditrichota bacterium]
EVAPDKSLQLTSLQLKQADFRVKEQRSKWFPQITMNTYLGTQQYRDDFGMSFDTENWARVSNMTLTLSIPIFNKFTTKNQYQSAIVDRNRFRHTLKQEERESQLADQLLLKEYTYSKAAANAAKANFRLSKENTDLQMQKFEQGIISLETYLDSFDDYLKAEVAYLNLLVDTYSYLSRILSRNI